MARMEMRKIFSCLFAPIPLLFEDEVAFFAKPQALFFAYSRGNCKTIAKCASA